MVIVDKGVSFFKLIFNNYNIESVIINEVRLTIIPLIGYTAYEINFGDKYINTKYRVGFVSRNIIPRLFCFIFTPYQKYYNSIQKIRII